MTALSKYRQVVTEKYPPTVLEFDDGSSASILSVQSMTDQQFVEFGEAHKTLSESDDSEDYVAIKSSMVELLAISSDNPEAVRTNLGHESLGVLTLIYKDYTESLNDATKSADDSGVSDRA